MLQLYAVGEVPHPLKHEITNSTVIIFFRGCAPAIFVTSYSVTYCTCVPGEPGICFYYYHAVYDECKYSDTFWLADRTRLFVQYANSLSSLCQRIRRHWTYKMPVRYILSSVWVRLSILSPLFIIQYVGLYVFSLVISLMMIERRCVVCLSIIIKSEVWTITHCLGLGHETMVSTVCLSIFLSLETHVIPNYDMVTPGAATAWLVLISDTHIWFTYQLLSPDSIDNIILQALYNNQLSIFG